MRIDKKRPLRETIYEKLVDDILNGRINAGEKLFESDLAEKFGVSRTPIREALLQLEKEGYTEHVKNVGATVKKISAQTVKEIFEVIAALEGEATMLAVAAGISRKDLDSLRQLQAEMTRAAEERDFIAYNRLNIRFHHFFLDRCGNETLIGIARDMRNRMYRIVSEGLSLPMNIERYLDSHDRIIEAVDSQLGDLAQQRMKAHIREASQGLVEMMIRRATAVY